MPFDPNTGAWQDPTYSTPGGGAFTALRMMNAPASFGAYQRQSGDQSLAMLHTLSQLDPDIADAYVNSPEGQHTMGAFGLSPDTVSNVLKNSPAAKFRSALSDLGENADTESIGRAGLMSGTIKPESVLGSYTKLQSAQGRIQQKAQQAMMEMMPKLTAQGMGEREAANTAVGMAFMGDPLSKARALEWVKGLSEEELRGPAAKANLAESQAANQQSLAEFHAAMLQPSVDLAKAHTALFRAAAELDATKKTAAAQGGLTEPQKAHLRYLAYEMEQGVKNTFMYKNALGQPVQKTHLTQQEQAFVTSAQAQIAQMRQAVGDPVEGTQITPGAAGGAGLPVRPRNAADPANILGQ